MSISRPYSHGVMFHHFHNEIHPVGQGSISAIQFENMIDWLGDRYNLLSAEEYVYKFDENKLNQGDICLTFDDALLCQFDIAAPILEKKNLRAFFFIYSSPFQGNPDNLEIYRYFRTTNFDNINKFYSQFFLKVRHLYSKKYELGAITFEEKNYLSEFPFYSEEDKWFRFIRDQLLKKEKYDEIMHQIMRDYYFSPNDVMKKLWMNEENLVQLKNFGHIIGLHSYTHPTTLHLLDRAAQEVEYMKNFKHLSELLNYIPNSMSHPCGNYNKDTLGLLDSKNIKMGFRSNCSIAEIRSGLEIPREDHANILREMVI